MLCSAWRAVSASAIACTPARIDCYCLLAKSAHVHVYVRSFTIKRSQRLEVSRTCLSYEGRLDGL